MYAEAYFNLPLSKRFTYRVPEGMEVEPGVRVTAPFGGRNLTGFVVETLEELRERGSFTIKEIIRVVDEEPVFDEEDLALAEWTARLYMCAPGEALAAMLPGGRRKSRLGLELGDEAPRKSPGEIELSDEQRRALETIFAAEKGSSYLYGITGSGKTEVFLRAAERILSEGRGVIYLVPEIALTHQILEEVRHRFGSAGAVIHSGLTPSQRLDEWKRIRRGEARIVVGARSAVFSPVRDLGLIIIDEEHEGSYKSGHTPRYHARQVAMHRITRSGGRLVMGSATPSVEAFHLMESGSITRIHLTRRLAGGSMPRIEVVDMKGEKGSISRRLEAEIRDTLSAGEQVILFLNRRGFSYFFHCRSCGYEMQCRHCSVSLTYHKEKERMICHYCGYSTPPAGVCPECGSFDVGYSGFGTEKIEEDITALFPDAVTGRLDTDTVRKRGSSFEIVEKFRGREIDILLGTQMVAKGLNFPGVSLVGIILADTGLSLPDFRSAERTFQLITQVSGRAGRFSPNGRVIIQTFRPENEAILFARGGDLPGFYRWELGIREALKFPPFSRLFRIVVRGRSRGPVEETSGELAEILLEYLPEEAELLGPAECPLAVISGNHRHQIIIRTSSFSRTHAVVGKILGDFAEKNKKVYFEIDVDPVSLL
jgi:primosomal protein N' (replication factor Y)